MRWRIRWVSVFQMISWSTINTSIHIQSIHPYPSTCAHIWFSHLPADVENCASIEGCKYRGLVKTVHLTQTSVRAREHCYSYWPECMWLRNTIYSSILRWERWEHVLYESKNQTAICLIRRRHRKKFIGRVDPVLIATQGWLAQAPVKWCPLPLSLSDGSQNQLNHLISRAHLVISIACGAKEKRKYPSRI